jgi:hypothetical protein
MVCAVIDELLEYRALGSVEEIEQELGYDTCMALRKKHGVFGESEDGDG